MTSSDVTPGKRVLITGTSGKVGGPTAEEFVAHGYHVRAFDKSPPGESLKGKVEAVYGDITDPLEVLRAAEGCDSVVHLAAIPDPLHGEDRIFTVNVSRTSSPRARRTASSGSRLRLRVARLGWFSPNTISTRNIFPWTKNTRRRRRICTAYPRCWLSKPPPLTHAGAE